MNNVVDVCTDSNSLSMIAKIKTFPLAWVVVEEDPNHLTLFPTAKRRAKEKENPRRKHLKMKQRTRVFLWVLLCETLAVLPGICPSLLSSHMHAHFAQLMSMIGMAK